MITLIGWIRPLPAFIEAALLAGTLTIEYSKKDDFDYLKGSVVTPTGVVVNFR